VLLWPVVDPVDQLERVAAQGMPYLDEPALR